MCFSVLLSLLGELAIAVSLYNHNYDSAAAGAVVCFIATLVAVSEYSVHRVAHKVELQRLNEQLTARDKHIGELQERNVDLEKYIDERKIKAEREAAVANLVNELNTIAETVFTEISADSQTDTEQPVHQATFTPKLLKRHQAIELLLEKLMETIEVHNGLTYRYADIVANTTIYNEELCSAVTDKYQMVKLVAKLKHEMTRRGYC